MASKSRVHAEPGWIRIGRTCSKGRRSLWIRGVREVIADGDCRPGERVGGQRLVAFEMRSGRDGDDGYVRIDDTNPQFAELWDVISCQVWSQDT